MSIVKSGTTYHVKSAKGRVLYRGERDECQLYIDSLREIRRGARTATKAVKNPRREKIVCVG